MKRFVLLCLAVLLLAGMYVFAEGSQEAATVNLSDPVTLTLWTHEDVNRKALEAELIEEFCRQHTNVSVDYQTYPSTKMREILTVAFSADQGPDIFNQSQSVIRQFVVQGRASSLDPEWIGEKHWRV